MQIYLSRNVSKAEKYAHLTFTMVSCNKREIVSFLKELNRQRDKCS